MDTKRTVLLLAVLVTSPTWAATRDDFNAAYAEYQQYAATNDRENILLSAERAWKIGQEVFGADNINTANLALNYGTLLNDEKRFDEAKPIVLHALEIQQDKYGHASPRIIDALVQKGKATVGRFTVSRLGKGRALSDFRRAQKIAEKNLDPLSIARVNEDIGLHLARVDTDGTDYFEPAYEIYRAELGEDNVRTALMAFHLGNIELSKGHNRKARDYLESSVATFSLHENLRRFELTARGFLVAALEELGDSDEATRHCLIIGEKKPLKSNEKMMPIYRKPPEFPKAALRNGNSGFAVVEFAVDDRGFTHDHHVIAASANAFHDSAIEHARTLRYAPRFVDGQPVETIGVKYRVNYKVVGERPFSYLKK